MSHRNAPLTPTGRKILVERIGSGRPIAHVAVEMGISRATATKWWRRWLGEGDDGLLDRSSRPRRSPRRCSRHLEERIVKLRRSRKIGPARIALLVAIPASTVHRVLVRHEISRLRWMDRPTGRVIRRYQREHPGELVHLDVKKIGKIPPGGGWRVRGRGAVKPRRLGYTYLHAAVDDCSRVAFVEAHDNERGETLLGFWERARRFFHAKGMIIDEVMTDNGRNFTSTEFAIALGRTGTTHRRTRPYQPQTNGKVERFNRTMADEFLYANVFRSETERRKRLDAWVHLYNCHRHHTAIGGPPASRVHNVCGHYS